MTRRDLLEALGAALLRPRGGGKIETVTGPVAASELGVTLMHEHVLVDFIGADKIVPDRYKADEVYEVVLPHLKKAFEMGYRTLVECTPMYLGRDVKLLQRLSEGSGIKILTNTGYYGASEGKFLPSHAHLDFVDGLAQRWIAEWKYGIDGTRIRPAFIKIGVDGAPLPPINKKLVRAACVTHRAAGLPIHQHTGSGAAALEALDILKEQEVPAAAFVWVHAQSEKDFNLHLEVARRGAWVEFDGIAPETVEQHVELVWKMTAMGQLRRTLVSHDAGWYHVGEPNGRTFRGWDTLATEFLPALRKVGFNQDGERQLLVENPKRVLTPRKVEAE